MQFNITNKSIIDLSKIFSPTILKELCSTGNSKKLRKILDELNKFRFEEGDHVKQ